MKLMILTSLLFFIFTTLAYCENLKWFKATDLGILGRDHTHDGYNRFTDDVFEKIKAEKMDSVYTLAHNCAGLHIDFSTNAEKLLIKYKVDNTPGIPNMPYSGSHGVDTYIKNNEKWIYFNK